MNSLFDRCLRTGKIAGAVTVATLAIFASSTLHAGIIVPSSLLAVSNTNQLRSYSFTGTLQETLAITGLPSTLSPTGVAQGVTVIDGRIFIGLVSTVASFTPKIVEVNPITGAVLNVLNTATPQITALGDDGTNLLLLDSVNVLDVYTYATNGTFVSKVAMQDPFPYNYQVEGIDGDGQSIFMAAVVGISPNITPILTNTTAGANVGHFETFSDASVGVGGLAYDPSDGTLWIGSRGEYRHYTQRGSLLSSFTADGTRITGLEVIHASAVVPEPSTITLFALGSLGLLGYGWRQQECWVGTASTQPTRLKEFYSIENKQLHGIIYTLA